MEVVMEREESSLTLLGDGVKYGLLKPFVYIIVNLCFLFSGKKSIKLSDEILVSVDNRKLKF